jgi:hypothetical protein
MSRSPSAEAAPVGAAVNQFVAQQSCQSDGQVQIRFAWSPSGYGNQWIDVSIQSNFAGWANAGPVGPLANTLDWGNLQPNTTYYSRISTWAGQWLTSDPIAFTTIICQGAFSPATNLRTDDINNGVRFRWDRGENNFWYCVDYATSVSDLNNLTGSWANYGCGTTGTQIDIPNSALPCGVTVYWRVWAAGPFTGGHSSRDDFEAADCTFSVAKNLKTTALTSTTVKFEWEKGLDNSWFCVDTGKSQSDLLNFTGTWKNYGCGTTATAVEVSGLECNTRYYWRVYAQGVTGQGHSVVATLDTPACVNFTVPHDLDTSDVTKTGAMLEWERGQNNVWFCVDLAESQSDLLNFTGTWKNFGCGQTSTGLELPEATLECNTTYYWRVFTQGVSGSGHSQVDQFKTEACAV